jgi:hypothetical protein
LLAIGTVALARNYSEYGIWASLQGDTVVFLVAWYAIFFVSYILFGQRGVPNAASPTSAGALRIAVLALCACAMGGAGLLIYEFAVNRGYGFNVTAADVRIMEVRRAQTAYGSALGGLGRLLTTALPAAFAVYIVSFKRIGLGVLPVMVLALAVVIYQQVSFEGGRFSIVGLAIISCVGGLIYAARSIRERREKRKSLKILSALVPLLFSIVVFVPVYYYSGLVTQSRVYSIEAVQSTAETVFRENAAHAEEQPPTVTAENLHRFSYTNYASSFLLDTSGLSDEKDFTSRQFGQAMAWIYLTQSFNELDRVLHYPRLKHAMGAYEFSHLWQLASLLSRKDYRYDVLENLPAAGTYSTLPGNNFIDFGWYGAFAFAFVFGAMLVLTIRTCLRSDGSIIGACAPILALIAFASPVTSLIQNFWPSLAWLALLEILVILTKLLRPDRDTALA